MRRFKLLKDLPGIDAGTILVEKVAFPGTSDLFIDGHAKRRAGLTLRKEEEFGEALSIGGVHYATADVEEWLEEIKPEFKRWRAKDGEPYFYVNHDAGVLSSREDLCPVDNDRHRLGNYFQTKEEAQAHVNYLKAIAVVREDAKGFEPDWSDNEQPKFNVHYWHKKEILLISDLYQFEDNGVFGLPYFETEEDARASIDKHKKEWETIFGIEK